MTRWIRFFIAILVGAALGLVYGWLVRPVRYIDTSPDTLRIDYRADYVLMVSEAFTTENDLALAVQRLAMLGSGQPTDLVLEAVNFGREQGYSEADLERMLALWDALQTAEAPGAGGVP